MDWFLYEKDLRHEKVEKFYFGKSFQRNHFSAIFSIPIFFSGKQKKNSNNRDLSQALCQYFST